ncbi:MAG: hypothetical protein AB8G15_15710 [Saprospiraceae bacterium]
MIRYFLYIFLFILILSCQRKISEIPTRVKGKTSFTDEEKSTLICLDCEDIKKLNQDDFSKVKFLSIYDRNCKLDDFLYKFERLEALGINTQKLDFPNKEKTINDLGGLYIHDIVFSSVPSFVLKQNKLEDLILWLRDDTAVNNEFLVLENLKKLTLTVEKLNEFPARLFKLKKLVQLRIVPIGLDKELRIVNLAEMGINDFQELETIELPIQSMSDFEKLKKLPKLKVLIIPSLPILEHYNFLKEFDFLQVFEVKNASARQRNQIRKLLPNVKTHYVFQ